MVILEEIAILKAEGIAFVDCRQNPPNAPQIRPIERYWALLKEKVYQGNWVAANRDQLIARIRYVLSKYQKELQSSIIKMMDGLPQKLLKAQSEGLNSVL